MNDVAHEVSIGSGRYRFEKTPAMNFTTMAELGRRPSETTFIESWIFNSSKVFALFPG